MSTRQYCTFQIARNLFGIDVQMVQEVGRLQAFTRVPLSPDVIFGLINLRGEIVTAIDLRRRLQFDDREDEGGLMSVVIRFEHYAVSLIVDRVKDIISVEAGLFEAAPETIASDLDHVIDGAYKLQEDLLIVLNPEKLLDLTSCFARKPVD